MLDALTATFDAVLGSVWLLPVLVVLIGLDGPFPVLPTETLLTVAATTAFGTRDLATVLGLFVAALVGSVLGDLLVYTVGRSSNRVLRSAVRDDGLAAWVRRHLWTRPVLACVGARLLPGGRLVSTAACGRVRLPVRRFLPATVVSSAVWSVYMLVVGALLAPLTHGDPLLSLAAGVGMALLTGGAFELARRIRRGVRARRAGVVEAEPDPAPARAA